MKNHDVIKTTLCTSLTFLIVVLSVFCVTPKVFAADEQILSDCTSGWKYSGNSIIDYSISGTEGTGLKVVGAWGVLRTLSLSIEAVNISEFDSIVWDMKIIDKNGYDILPDVFKAYADSIVFSIKDADKNSYAFSCDEITAQLCNDGWYGMCVRLNNINGIDLSCITDISIVTLSTNSFNTDLPEAYYCLDSFKASKDSGIEPRLLGVQMSSDEKALRFTAAVSKENYEKYRRRYGALEYGFLYCDKAVPVLDENAETQGVKKYKADKIYNSNNDSELLFDFILNGYSENQFKDNKITVRAYISFYDDTGMKKMFYSNDSYNGGYAVSWNDTAAETAAYNALETAKNINYIEDNTPVIVPKKVNNTSREAGKPFAVDVKYDDGAGVCIAVYDAVADFNVPVNDPSKDASAAIRRCLEAARKIGGVVYIPEGIYYCKTPITIPGGVTFRGEWQSPDKAAPASNGTVLVVQTGNIEASPKPFISLETGAGLRNINIIYPDAAFGKTDTYSATIAQSPSFGSDSYTVFNTTVMGGSVGYDGATAWNELPYLKNVYISSLESGIKFNNVTDIGRLENIHISPKYLLDNVLYTMSDDNKALISEYMKQHTDGIHIRRSDWQYAYNINISGINRGIAFESYVDTTDNDRVRGSNGQMFGVNIENCNIAFDVVYTNAIGYSLTEINIKNCDTGIRFSEDFFSIFEIMNMNISGKTNIPVLLNSKNNGKVIISKSQFLCSTGNNYSVTVNGGGISLQECKFMQRAKHIEAGTDSGAVSILGCSFNGIADIRRPSGKQNNIYFNSSPLNLPDMSYSHKYRKSIPTASSNAVYNVEDYGAVSGADSTAAFKKALNAARNTGGIVYVPKGEYFVEEPLTVPSGVELRGIYNVPTHSVTAGSVICTSYGKNDPSGKAFISLEESSGINGISFYYTEQSFIDFIPYAWTVQSLGKNCWAVNSVFINSYNALDFATNPSDGHYINYVSGCALKCGIYVGNNMSNGWVENVQFNPHYWKRARITDMDLTDSEQLNSLLNYSLEAMVFADNASEHVLACFAYASENLIVFEDCGKGGTNGVFIGHGSDGCRNAVKVDGIDCVAMINPELVSMSFDSDMHHIIMNPDNDGTLILFNAQAWGQPLNSSIELNSGNLIINQMFYWGIENTENIVNANGGVLCMFGTLMPEKNAQIVLAGDVKAVLKGNMTLNNSSSDKKSDSVTCRNDSSAFLQKFTWWL